MAHPLKTWRRWHRKVNLNQRRHALASAIAATACAPLVAARGHRVFGVPQLPLILDDTVAQVSQTSEVIALLKAFGAFEDVKRALATRKVLRAGKGKMRGRRNKVRRGPLIVVDEGAQNLQRALRNVPGVDVLNVNRLNIRSLAPGGHLGRFCIWTKSAFNSLEKHFGSGKGVASTKKGYRLQHDVVTSADVSQVINSDEVQRVLVDKKAQAKRTRGLKANPLRNRKAMEKLNPYSKVLREMNQKKAGLKKKITKAQRKALYNRSKLSKKRTQALLEKCDDCAEDLKAVYHEQVKSMHV